METQNVNSDQEFAPQERKSETTYPAPPIPPQKTTGRYHFVLKALMIGFLTLLLMIPTVLIGNLIHEREKTAEEASRNVHREWSGSQTIYGPILTVPYTETVITRNEKNEEKREKIYRWIHILPETLDIQGALNTKDLKRSIYEIVVFNAPLEIKGSFVLPEEIGDISEDALKELLTNEAVLNIGLSDMRGISNQIVMNWDNEKLIFNPGISQCTLLESGVSARVDMISLMTNGTVEFSVKLDLKGSEALCFAPMGKTTTVSLKSDCKTPSFTGAFLPENRDVTNEGFTADWKVMHLNRNYPQVMVGEQWKYGIDESVFRVEMLIPVQHYQKSMRSVKYAILIILLTFVVSFFVEVIQKRKIHPVQYLLIGLALCLFYSLLVSISEHTSFTLAYLIAATMTVTLLTCYMAGVLKIKRTAFTIGGLLAVLYLYIFILIQMETYALLAGSLGLFVILAVIMYFSQRINWNGNE
jgi:inner membrane protein